MRLNSLTSLRLYFLFLLFIFSIISVPTSSAHLWLECTKQKDSLATDCKSLAHAHGNDVAESTMGIETVPGKFIKCPAPDPCHYMYILPGCSCFCGQVQCPEDGIEIPGFPVILPIQ